MASILTRVQRSCQHTLQASCPRVARQQFHHTPIALKKKQKRGASDDLFSDDGSAGELFSTSQHLFGVSVTGASTSSNTVPSSSGASASGKLNAGERSKRFQELQKFVSDRIGKHPVQKIPEVRNSAWQHLFMLATSPKQMEEVVDMMPKWRDSHRSFDEKIAEVFIRRCEENHCPSLALKVFSDHPKYGLDIGGLSNARRLLHSLHNEHPLEQSITLSALFRVYDLPAVSTDLVSCAMLTSACFKHGSKPSLAIAHEMVPHLQAMLSKVNPTKLQISQDQATRATLKEKEKTWLAWTLAKIENALSKEGKDSSWLKKWREESGYAQRFSVAN